MNQKTGAEVVCGNTSTPEGLGTLSSVVKDEWLLLVVEFIVVVVVGDWTRSSVGVM